MEQSQDFSKKMVVVLREDLQSWQLTNTVGHITAYLGNKMQENFDTGVYFKSKDGYSLPRNSQYAVVALKASKSDLENLLSKLHGSSMLWIAFVQEMIDMIDDAALARALEEKTSDEMDVLGIGLFGDKEALKLLTGALRLWK